MTVKECAVVMAYTGIAMLTGDNLKYFYQYVDDLLGERVFTHDLCTRMEEIRAKSKPDFIVFVKIKSRTIIDDMLAVIKEVAKFFIANCNTRVQ